MDKINYKHIRDLIKDYKNSDKTDITKLYKCCYDLIYRIGFSILKNTDDAHDITQNVFKKLIEIDKNILPVKNETSWLYTVTKNECFMFLRKNHKCENLEDMYDVKEEKTDITNIIEREDFNKLISGLNEKEKQIICLKIISKLKFKEIAQLLNMPVGTVQWIYYKAVNSLKISVTSLGMSIITFVLGLKTANKNKKTNSNINDTNKFETKSKDEYKGSLITENMENSLMESTVCADSMVGNTGNSILKETILFSFSGIFLIITIFFTIIFLKHQQKRERKSSK